MISDLFYDFVLQFTANNTPETLSLTEYHIPSHCVVSHSIVSHCIYQYLLTQAVPTLFKLGFPTLFACSGSKMWYADTI